MPILATAFYEDSNYIEAGLWVLLAVVLAAKTILQVHRGRAYYLLAAGILLVFGLSDVAEAMVDTGSWWEPWWLLVWKGTCVVALLALVIAYFRAGREEMPEKTESRA